MTVYITNAVNSHNRLERINYDGHSNKTEIIIQTSKTQNSIRSYSFDAFYCKRTERMEKYSTARQIP